MRRLSLLLLPSMLLSGLASAAPYQRPGLTERLSVASSGKESEVAVGFAVPRMSADGRLVVFSSAADNLVPGDDNGFTDVFLRDRQQGTIERLPVATGGAETDGGSFSASISADGRTVAFASTATNLVPGDANGKTDVFVLERETGKLSNVTAGANGNSSLPLISGDGRHVAFNSVATNLVPGDTTAAADTFVHDLDASTTRLVSVASAGGAAGSVDAPAVSADGRFVAFNSGSTALVAGDANVRTDTFVRDMQTGVTELVSVSSEERQTKESVYSAPSISADGRRVTFDTWSWQLVPLDTNGDVGPVFITFALGFDVYVRDRLTGTTTEVSLTSAGIESERDSGYPQLSPDGRYVTFTTPSSNLVPGDTAGQTDVFVHDLVTATTERISLSTTGQQGDGASFLSSISEGGRVVAFQSSASNLGQGDFNGVVDVFVRDRGDELGIVGPSAVRDGGDVTVTGDVSLSGAPVASDVDPAGDSTVAVPGSDLAGATIVYRPELDDLLLRLDVTDLPEIRDPRVQAGTAGTMGLVYGVELTTGGSRFVARGSQRGAAVSPRVRDESGFRLTPSSEETWDFELLACGETCAVGTAVASLQGSYGTAGDEVRIAIPLAALGLTPGGSVSQVSAFTAPGDAAASASTLDVRALSSFTVPRSTVRIGSSGTVTEVAAAGGRFASVVTGADGFVDLRACLDVCGPTIRVEVREA